MNAQTQHNTIDTLAAQVAYLVERQKKQEELIAEMTPILKEVMSTATSKLDAMEKKGYFAFGREMAALGERVLESYSPEDVRELGAAIVTILDTVRALTQPRVLQIVSQASGVLQNADATEPIGIVGMVRASGDQDVQKGMAVMMDVLRHVGHAAKALSEEKARRAKPGDARKERLAATLGPRRKALGVERPVPGASAPRPAAKPAASCATGPSVPGKVAAVIDGVSFSADGHLADPSQWTRPLAASLAAAQGITLDETRWKLVDLARADFEETKQSPNIRRLTQVSGIATKDIYALFPKAPGRTIAKIAGIPKPTGCL